MKNLTERQLVIRDLLMCLIWFLVFATVLVTGIGIGAGIVTWIFK